MWLVDLFTQMCISLSPPKANLVPIPLKTASHDAYMTATTVATRVAPVIPVIAIYIAMPTL